MAHKVRYTSKDTSWKLERYKKTSCHGGHSPAVGILHSFIVPRIPIALLRKSGNDVFIILNFEPTMRSESRGQVYLGYAEPQGGNEDSLLVILNFESLPLP